MTTSVESQLIAIEQVRILSIKICCFDEYKQGADNGETIPSFFTAEELLGTLDDLTTTYSYALQHVSQLTGVDITIWEALAEYFQDEFWKEASLLDKVYSYKNEHRYCRRTTWSLIREATTKYQNRRSNAYVGFFLADFWENKQPKL